MLSLRTGTILKSIVEQYTIKATPVPSQSIASEPELGISSATIRNEVAYLEHKGYITRPHPSAGGIPTDKGYRYYVNRLSNVKLPLAEQRLISHLFHQVEGDLEEWLSLTATIAARLAKNVSIVTTPKSAQCRFKYLELVALRELLALVVLVLHGAKIKQKLVTFDKVINQAKLTTITNKLNIAYSGLSISQISAKDLSLSPIEQQITDSLLSIMQTENEQDYEEPYLNGWHFMFSQPEFTRSHQMSDLMELVEQRNLLRSIIPQKLPSSGAQVIIGKENKTRIIQNYSVVIKQYGLPDKVIGTISILGPTRMPYARTIATLDYLSSLLSELIAELYDGN